MSVEIELQTLELFLNSDWRVSRYRFEDGKVFIYTSPRCEANDVGLLAIELEEEHGVYNTINLVEESLIVGFLN